MFIIRIFCLACIFPVLVCPLEAAAGTIPVRAGPSIRVLLKKATRATIRCPAGDFSIWDSRKNRQLIQIPAARSGTILLRQGRWQMLSSNGRNIWPQYQDVGSLLEIRPERGDILELDGEKKSSYRGKLQIIRLDSGRFAVVNVTDIEDYLTGVVGAEMWGNWPMAALRAQSIACRSYALFFMYCRSHPEPWDVGDTQAHQVYGGVAAESLRVSRAVQQTHGVVLTYGPPGREKLFPAYYSAVCGGHTEDAAAVFGKQLPPLSGRVCPYCKRTAPANKYRWPSVTISKYLASELLMDHIKSLAPLGRIAEIKVVRQSDYGRVEMVELRGTNGLTHRIRGEDLRLALSTREKPLYSSWFRLVDMDRAWRFENGRGWGHGVGLCQYGAKQMALLGKDCIDILLFYYPQATLVRAW